MGVCHEKYRVLSRVLLSAAFDVRQVFGESCCFETRPAAHKPKRWCRSKAVSLPSLINGPRRADTVIFGLSTIEAEFNTFGLN